MDDPGGLSFQYRGFHAGMKIVVSLENPGFIPHAGFNVLPEGIGTSLHNHRLYLAAVKFFCYLRDNGFAKIAPDRFGMGMFFFPEVIEDDGRGFVIEQLQVGGQSQFLVDNQP